MKVDPEGYGSELNLIYNQFKSSLELFERQAAMNFTSLSGIGNDPTVAKDLGDRSMFWPMLFYLPKTVVLLSEGTGSVSKIICTIAAVRTQDECDSCFDYVD
ncbi:hypothetical protein F511_42275 [Dorcoceras hygrometricum]|uniref:Uncharacterized protein n=1 Tax=Dorcoceras hygrometricum TaxID=472368 RepID=A0A2Z7A6K3_9LAMI|nr:hypothetical protein F511_42275 [Dorcoceras hygrometricum]